MSATNKASIYFNLPKIKHEKSGIESIACFLSMLWHDNNVKYFK